MPNETSGSPSNAAEEPTKKADGSDEGGDEKTHEEAAEPPKSKRFADPRNFCLHCGSSWGSLNCMPSSFSTSVPFSSRSKSDNVQRDDSGLTARYLEVLSFPHELPQEVPHFVTIEPQMTQRQLLDGALANIAESLGRLRLMEQFLLALKWTTQFTETPEGTVAGKVSPGNLVHDPAGEALAPGPETSAPGTPRWGPTGVLLPMGGSGGAGAGFASASVSTAAASAPSSVRWQESRGHELPEEVPYFVTLQPQMMQRMLLDGVINNIEESLGRLRVMRQYLLALKWTTQYTETPEGTLFR